MFSRIYHFFGPPLVLCVSIPFATFAAFTTSIAFSVLFVRLLVVYVDLGIALIHGAISPSSSGADHGLASTPSRSPVYETGAGSRRRQSFVGTNTPPNRGVAKTSSFASLTGTGTDRDYEGVGGWRLSVDDEDEALWLNLNSRLELPAVSSPASRRHKRSLTGASQMGSPEFPRSPSLLRSKTPGTASPEGYFSVPLIGNPPHREGNSSGISRVIFDPKNNTAMSSTESFGLRPGSKGMTKSRVPS